LIGPLFVKWWIAERGQEAGGAKFRDCSNGGRGEEDPLVCSTDLTSEASLALLGTPVVDGSVNRTILKGLSCYMVVTRDMLE